MKTNQLFQNISDAKNILSQDASTLAKLAKRERVAPYIGLVGYKNLGDEVLYEAHKKLFPLHELAPYGKEAMILERISRLFGSSFCNHAILGGGTLINGYIWIDKTERLLEQNFQMICIGTGAEDSRFRGESDKTSRLLKRWIKALDKFEFVGVRGPHSKKTLETGGAKNIVVTGDTALSLAEDSIKKQGSKNTVGITYGNVNGSPMWGDANLYKMELVKVVKEVIRSGMKVKLLPIWEMDLPSNKDLLKEINSPYCEIIEEFESYDGFSRALRDCDIFIGQKLHSTVLALMNRVPSVMIEYRPKCRDFMASLGLEDYVIRTSELKLSSFMDVYKNVQKNHSKIKSIAEERILGYKDQQRKYAKKLSYVFEHKRNSNLS